MSEPQNDFGRWAEPNLPDPDFDDPECLEEDLFQVAVGDVIVDIGWYPEMDPNGTFVCRAVADQHSFDRPIQTFETRDPGVALAWLRTWRLAYAAGKREQREADAPATKLGFIESAPIETDDEGTICLKVAGAPQIYLTRELVLKMCAAIRSTELGSNQ